MNLKDNCVHASTHNSLLATTCDYGLTQLVTKPTRLDNTLDLFFTDHPSQITDISVLPGMSDHNIVLWWTLNSNLLLNYQEKFYYIIKPIGMLSDRVSLPLQLISPNRLVKIATLNTAGPYSKTQCLTSWQDTFYVGPLTSDHLDHKPHKRAHQKAKHPVQSIQNIKIS